MIKKSGCSTDVLPLHRLSIFLLMQKNRIKIYMKDKPGPRQFKRQIGLPILVQDFK